ncbi:Ribonuclease H-like domain containing protein [uncultured Caudovirales phage]|uniref:Ribonuclease H-like domain containing protein n=1 Tax=uncultured Caudovirales phage TaxID=2100421 RepID=A0A6J5N058_9CAUD|nr:Ribonuclease H-like domain containing protein [uncultured Caudovirales phage]
MKILFLDLETSPNLAHVWGLWDQNIAITQIERSTEVICWGARWLGQDKVMFKSVHHHGKEAMLDELHKVMDEADVLIGWNSAAFDSKHIKREFIENGYLPPSPWIELDLMRIVRSQFKFPSNKLDYVAQKLGVGAKVKHSGFQLWLDCMAGIPKAWKEMKEYQIQDVNLLIDLYNILLPWIKNHPHQGLDLAEPRSCRNCGSTEIKRWGYRYNATTKLQRYKCMGCGGYLSGEVITKVATK